MSGEWRVEVSEYGHANIWCDDVIMVTVHSGQADAEAIAAAMNAREQPASIGGGNWRIEPNTELSGFDIYQGDNDKRHAAWAALKEDAEAIVAAMNAREQGEPVVGAKIGDDYLAKGADHKTFGISVYEGNTSPGLNGWHGNQVEVHGNQSLRDRILRLLTTSPAPIDAVAVVTRIQRAEEQAFRAFDSRSIPTSDVLLKIHLALMEQLREILRALGDPASLHPKGGDRTDQPGSRNDAGAGDDRGSAPAPLTHAQLDKIEQAIRSSHLSSSLVAIDVRRRALDTIARARKGAAP